MLRLTSWVVVSVAAGCTSAERPPPPPSAAEPLGATATPVHVPRPVRAETPMWRWTSILGEDGPQWSLERALAERGDVMVTATGDSHEGVEVVAKGPELSWTARIGQRQSNAVALAMTDDAIYAAHFHAIATGARVAKLDATDGAVQWDQPLTGVGPIGHSKYRNEVQVRLSDDGLHVYGWESGGAYVEVVDLDTGAQRHHADVDMTLATLPWTWEGDPDDWVHGATRFSVSDGVTARLVDDDAARLVLEGEPDGPRQVDLPVAEGELATGAGLVLDDTIYFVHGSGISTGARLYAIDRDALTTRWQRDLYGVGPVGHSEYFNMLQIGTAAGHVVVYGNEAYGRYLEVVDPVSGTSVVNKVWTGRA